MPLMERQEIDLDPIIQHGLISFTNVRQKETDKERKKQTVHFFIDDFKFDEVWIDPPAYIDRLKAYCQVMSPDFSTYTNVPLALQAFNVFRNRWCACYWQSKGIIVIPTVTWSTPYSYDFVFDGVRRNSVVALSSIGSSGIYTKPFLDGFIAMCKEVKPSTVICYGEPYEEMFKFADILYVPYEHGSKEDVDDVSADLISRIKLVKKGKTIPKNMREELRQP
jgi:hypothetical protein